MDLKAELAKLDAGQLERLREWLSDGDPVDRERTIPRKLYTGEYNEH
jgi:hypothetical protein